MVSFVFILFKNHPEDRLSVVCHRDCILDHVTSHHRELNWLPISHMVQLQSIAAMSR